MGKKKGREEYKIAEILRDHLEAYRKKYRLSYDQLRAANDIMRCRTRAMGGMIVACDKCGKWEFRFKSAIPGRKPK